MKIEFDVNMTVGKMYDYMLRHVMTSFQGILGEAVGILLMVGFFLTYKWVYLVAGIVIVLYLPVTLYLKSRHQVMNNEVFKQPLHYVMDDEGITVSVDGNSDSQKWKDMYRAVSTTRSVILYTNHVNACIFPKDDLGSKKDDVIEMISTHMEPKRVNIR